MTIRQCCSRSIAAAGLLFCTAAAATAQSTTSVTSAAYLFKPGNLTVTISAGGAAFTDFQQGRARATKSGTGEQSDFTRRISARTTMTGSAAFTAWLSNSFGLRLQGTYIPTRFSVVNEATEPEGSLGLGDTTRYARMDIWIADVSVVVRPPLDFGRVHPYLMLGAGAARFNVQGDLALVPPEAVDAFTPTDRTQITALIGIGALIPLQRNRLLLSFSLTDHLIRSPIEAGGATFDESGTLVETRDQDEDGIAISSMARLTVGLTIPLRLQ